MKLNIACGREVLKGYLNIDIDPVKDKGIMAADALALPFKNEVFEEVYCSHFLEHVPLLDIIDTVRDWKRVLKTGGKLIICVPDMSVMAKYWLLESLPRKISWWTQAMFGTGEVVERQTGNFHKCGLDRDVLKWLFIKTGFLKYRFWQDQKWDFWLWAEAIK